MSALVRYITTRTFNVGSGRVQLTDKQAVVRIKNLKPVGGGVYQVLEPIQLKTGEVFSWDGVPTKAGGIEPTEAAAKAAGASEAASPYVPPVNLTPEELLDPANAKGEPEPEPEPEVKTGKTSKRK